MAIGKRQQIIEGLKILETYDPGGECCADHDILMGLFPGMSVSEDDKKKLVELEWYYDVEGWAILL